MALDIVARGLAAGAKTYADDAEDAKNAAEAAAVAAEEAAQTLTLDPTLTSPTQAAQAKAAGDAIRATQSMIAGRESSSTATKNYSVGDLVIVSDALYRVTAAIASGETITPGTNVAQTAISGEINDKISESYIGANMYDEAHNSVVQSDPQYTIGTVFLNGYTGDIVISCKEQVGGANYITDLHVYNEGGTDLGVSLGSKFPNPYGDRSGKKATIPNGAYRLTFKYRTTYSQGALVVDVMVTKGSLVPDIYYAYDSGNVVVKSPYLTRDSDQFCVYVSPDGDDTNDGLTVGTAFATFRKALTVSNTIYAVRGTYAEQIFLNYRKNVKLIAYQDGTAYSHTTPKLAKVEITKGVKFTFCDGLYIEDFKFVTDNAGTEPSVYFENCDNVRLMNCVANDSPGGMGFSFVNSNAVLDHCSASGNHTDGFNFHGYGASVMIDCEALNNGDDGCSHHDGCEGFINGGKFNGNTKAGIAPAYGAKVEISNVLCANNNHGIAYFTTDNGHAAMTGAVNSCAMVGNNYGLTVQPLATVTAINCAYSGNTTDKNVTGSIVEYNC